MHVLQTLHLQLSPFGLILCNTYYVEPSAINYADETMRSIARGLGGAAAKNTLCLEDAEAAWGIMQRTFEELVDMARLTPEPLPVILVGGGAILVGDVRACITLTMVPLSSHTARPDRCFSSRCDN